MKWWKAMMLLLLAGMLAACDKTPKAPLVFAGQAWPGYEAFYLADKLGYLPKQGLQLTTYADTAQVVEALRSHRAHLAALPLEQALLLRRELPDLKIVLLLDASHGADALLAQPGIDGWAQLQGKRIGMADPVCGGYLLHLAARQANLRGFEFEPVTLPAAGQQAAFAARQVEALVAAEPLRARLVAGGAQQLFDSARAPGKLVDVLVTRDDDIGMYHQEMGQLLQGWRRALDYIEAERAQALQQMAGHENLAAGEVELILRGIELYGLARNRELLLSEPLAAAPTIDAGERYLLDIGQLKMGEDATGLVDPTLLAEFKP